MTTTLRFRAFAAAATAALLAQSASAQDICATAAPIFDGMTAFDTNSATDEGQAVSCGSGAAFDIWYVYSAVTSGSLTVSTCSAATFDTRLEIFDSCGGTILGCNDDGSGCSGFTSELTVNVAGAGDVYIRVMGYNGATGTGTLTVDGPTIPDDCATAADISVDTLTAFDTAVATPSAEIWSCTSNTPNDVWYTFIASDSYAASASTCSMANYDTRIEVFDGACGALNSIVCNDDGPGCSGFTSLADFPAVIGVQYWIRVGGFNNTSAGQGDLLVTGPPAAVANDECVNALALDNGVLTAFDTTLATASGNVPTPSCGGSDPIDIWYTVTPLVDGVVMVETCGSALDTRLVAYEGGCGSLTEIVCNDDACGLQSALSFPGIGGTTYTIRVGGFLTRTGPGDVLATFADMHPNDDCSGAILIGTGTTIYNTTGATDSGVDMSCVLNGESNDLWYLYTAGIDGNVTVDLSGSLYDTGMAIYGGDCLNLVEIACDDDGGTGLRSLISFTAVAGTTYAIQVGGFSTAVGSGIINITEGLGMIVCVGEPNSSGAGAALTIGGSDVVADNNLILTVTGLPANAMGYFVHSMETNFVMNPGGSEGSLCIASFTMGRFAGNALNSGAGGTVTFTPDLTALPTAMGSVMAAPGETRFFQYWTRDMSGAGTATSNFSGATGVTLQ